MSWTPTEIGYRATAGAANNQLAAAQRAGAGRSVAGAGLRRGAGQRAMDDYRSGVAQAAGESQAGAARQEDAFANQQAQMAARFGRANERLEYDSLNEQMRQSMWDSRFNNMQSAWGALAGLLQ